MALRCRTLASALTVDPDRYFSKLLSLDTVQVPQEARAKRLHERTKELLRIVEVRPFETL